MWNRLSSREISFYEIMHFLMLYKISFRALVWLREQTYFLLTKFRASKFFGVRRETFDRSPFQNCRFSSKKHRLSSILREIKIRKIFSTSYFREFIVRMPLESFGCYCVGHQEGGSISSFYKRDMILHSGICHLFKGVHSVIFVSFLFAFQ